jgi:hypothetical protein
VHVAFEDAEAYAHWAGKALPRRAATTRWCASRRCPLPLPIHNRTDRHRPARQQSDSDAGAFDLRVSQPRSSDAALRRCGRNSSIVGCDQPRANR